MDRDCLMPRPAHAGGNRVERPAVAVTGRRLARPRLPAPDHNRRFAIAPEAPGSAFVPFPGKLDDILCVQKERTVAGDNTVRYQGARLANPQAQAPPPLRQGQGPGP